MVFVLQSIISINELNNIQRILFLVNENLMNSAAFIYCTRFCSCNGICVSRTRTMDTVQTDHIPRGDLFARIY